MKKVLGSLLGLIALSASSSYGFQLLLPNFQAGDPLQDKFSMVHFTLPNVSLNNFQGAFFWLPSAQVNGATEANYPSLWTPISFGGTTKYCSKRVRGLYYNNARGARLWPLDDQTRLGLAALDLNGIYSYTGLVLIDGLYGTCGLSGTVDLRSIYGQLAFTGTAAAPANYGSISAGLMYVPATNLVNLTAPLGLYPSLQYFNNEIPLGYIYDTFGGIGFVGGQMLVSGHEAVLHEILHYTGSINGIFGFSGNVNTAQAYTHSGNFSLIDDLGDGLDTLWNISVLGNILFGRGGLDATNRQSLLGNPINSSAAIFSDVVNTSDILNELRKNANNLCKGEQWYNEGNIGAATPWSPNGSINAAGLKVLCIGSNTQDGISYDQSGVPATPVIINLNNTSEYQGVEIIVRGRNVVLEGSVPDGNHALNIFVDNGNVFLQNDDFTTHVVAPVGADETFRTFNAQGNLVTVAGGMINGVNIPAPQTTPQIYDALLAAGQTGAVNYAKYLRGNIFVNGIVAGRDGATAVPVANKYYVHGKLTSLNTALTQSAPRETLIYNIFGVWDAPLYASLIDFTSAFTWACGINGFSENNAQWPCQVANDQFKFRSLVLIDRPIPTSLYK